MTSAGRGRGRGRGRGWAQNDTGPLPKPGKSSCSEDVDYANIINIIDRVTNENLQQQTKEFLQCTSMDNRKDITEKLYEHALNNKEFGTKLIIVYHYSTSIEINDITHNKCLRNPLIGILQIQYDQRIEMRQKNTTTQFCNAIHVFSEFLRRMLPPRMFPHMSLFRRLQGVLLDYMEMLLETACTEEIKTFTEQIIVHGETVYSYFKEKMDNLMIIVRQILFKEDLSLESRQMLLYTLDLVSHNFQPLPKILYEFYELQLGKNFIQWSAKEDSETSNNELNDQDSQSEHLKNRNLRAIRGSGAAGVKIKKRSLKKFHSNSTRNDTVNYDTLADQSNST